jgi:hypothetical protein
MVFIQAPIEITTPPKRYPPVGHCIYCGVYSKKLTKEHIIAHGLAGDSLILPKSSCRDCADKTRDSETACLRHLWWPFRTRMGLPSSGKQPPESFTVRQMKVTKTHDDGSIESYDKIAETIVEPMEFPLVFLALKFSFPGLIIGRDPNAGIDNEVIGRISNEEVRKFAPGDKDGFRIAPMNVDAYCRMLAKIAHSYAVAELGPNSFRPVLREFIRGKILEQAWHWIGSDTAVPPAEQHLHDIQWSAPTVNGINYVMVSLRLFSFIGSPRYHLIVGELTRPLDQLPFLQQPLYTIDVKAPLPLGELVPLNQGLGGTAPRNSISS